jgi:hypothetical protein
MAIAAQVNHTDRDDGAGDGDASTTSVQAHANATATVTNDHAIGHPVLIDIVGNNTIRDSAFTNAAGAFNVLQNASIQSTVQQGMAIAAIVNSDKDGDPLAAFDLDHQVALSSAVLNATVTGNATTPGAGIGINASNTITNAAFQHAKGAFQVMQNQSTNSAVQQTMSISAVVNK